MQETYSRGYASINEGHFFQPFNAASLPLELVHANQLHPDSLADPQICGSSCVVLRSVVFPLQGLQNGASRNCCWPQLALPDK